jgi:hypothetical protein
VGKIVCAAVLVGIARERSCPRVTRIAGAVPTLRLPLFGISTQKAAGLESRILVIAADSGS